MPYLTLTKFGQTRRVKYTPWYMNGECQPWESGNPVLWVERAEDMYALDSYRREGKGQTVAIVRRENWLRAEREE